MRVDARAQGVTVAKVASVAVANSAGVKPEHTDIQASSVN